jgi:cytochrome P450
MTKSTCPLPSGDPKSGLKILKEFMRDRSLLTALAQMHRHVGDAFQIPLPRFQPAVFVGPQANRQIMVTDRQKFAWRNPNDPVTHLLRNGILVLDGDEHDELRALMNPMLQRSNVERHIETMWQSTNQISSTWKEGETRDMLVEMRRIALLILVGSLFSIDFSKDLERMWHPILKLLEYISPGLWILWPGMPRPQYRSAIQEMDCYLYQVIRTRRQELANGHREITGGDLLSHLVATPGMSDDLIRDQLLTMLIAGHDTSTALLAWALYLLGGHPDWMAQVRAEVEHVLYCDREPPTLEQLNKLQFTDQVIKETLRLYPPIHVGNRLVTEDLSLQGFDVRAGTRVMASIYLSHRDEGCWPEPDCFRPERFNRSQEHQRPPLTYIPFGGGPRNCIGATFAQIEAKVVLGCLLQRFDLELLNGAEIHPYMGATLEPRPGVRMRIQSNRLLGRGLL